MSEDLLRQEREVEELLKRVSPGVIGARLCRARKRQGWSIRQLAEAAHVNKNSVVRLENGGMPQPLTVLKVCAALGLHLASIAEPEHNPSEIVSVHRAENDRWYDLTDFGAGPLADTPLTPSERAKRARQGVKTPMLMLKSKLDNGQLMGRVLELYGESQSRSHRGEEMVYVLSGSARITVGVETFELAAGESATFWSSEEHIYAPADGARLPVRLLLVTVHQGPSKNFGNG